MPKKLYLKYFLLIISILFSRIAISQNPDEQRLITLISDNIDNTKYDLASAQIDSLLALSTKNKSQKGIASSYNLKGALFREQSKPKDAIHYYNRSKQIFEELKDLRGIAGCYVNIGAIYSGLGETKIALSYYFKALKLYDQIGEQKEIAILYNNIGTTYQKTDQIGSSNVYLLKAFSSAYTRGDSLLMAMSTHNLGINYEELRIYDSAIVCYNRSLNYLANYGIGPGHIFNHRQLGHCYYSKGDYKKAEHHFQEALEISNETGVNSSLEDLYMELSGLMEKNKNYQKALEYNKKFILLKDSMSVEKMKNELMKSEFENELVQQKKLQAEEQKNRDAISKAKLEAKNKIITASLVALFVVFLLVIFIFRGYRQKQRANEIISKQKELVEEKNNEILSSINYAKRIQTALLTSDAYLKKYLNDFFILYKPKDIVSGDFYWGVEHKGIVYLVVADCTGHGVPGAFMSLLNISILNELIIERGFSKPDVILNEARNEIIRSLNPEGGDESKDGMDCILLAFDFKAGKLEYACANNSFYLVRNSELQISKTNKMPVGKSHDDTKLFVSQELDLQKGDLLYLITDGYADQFGGPKQKKFKYKPLQELILTIQSMPLSQQKQQLSEKFDSWKGSLEQVDDVCIIGIKI